ncbi:MAG: hypothetical protein JSW11_09985 [Candidatus Heimdallarchaeota archaeon]|nr:MAG: hypothetical protein JSW11_09985 [Candidatus Heimdallarchaeota archaeon]
MAISQFEDPIDLINIIIVVIAIILFLLLGIYLLNSYRRTKRNTTLYMSLLLLFGSLALVSLALEQVVLIASDVVPADAPEKKSFLVYSFDEINVFWLSYFFAFIAWVTSASAILSACFFTQSFFSDKYKKLLIIPAIMLALWVIVYTAAPFQWEYLELAGDWQPQHDPEFEILGYLFLFPNLWMIVLLFFYLTLSLYRRGVPRWKQTLVLAIGQALLSLGFTVEIINVQVPIISLFARIAIMIYPIVVWIGLRRG